MREKLLAVIEKAKQSEQTSLDLRWQDIKELPLEIGQLTQLTTLNLSSNQLTTVPEAIKQLIRLTTLNLSSNQLTTVPEAIKQLIRLEFLYLRNNKFTELPSWIGESINLKDIDLGFNQIETVPNSFGKLINLQRLYLSGNKLQALPSSFDQLSRIDALYLSFNQFKILPELIGRLNHLTQLDISSIQLEELPVYLKDLKNLVFLDLSYNRLRTLPEWIGQLKQLKELKLTSNDLTELPFALIQLSQLKRLHLISNKNLNIPIEITRKYAKPYLVLDFLRQLQEEGVDHIYEAKLLIIGEGGAGKTSLANKLRNSKYQLKVEGSATPEKSTEGIDVLRLDFTHPSGNPFRINLWDFGGQEIYHATHQFFLTRRSLYLLVADTRQDNTDFNYWLEVVELLSEASPALIIKNEKQDRPCQVNENQLRGRFSNLEKILPTNLATNRGLPEILAAIKHHISQLPHIGSPLPKTWVNVRKALEAEPRNHITQVEFLALCDTHGFKRREDKLQLSGDLHDLGVCLHFQDDPVLKHFVILKPEWGTAAVYKVLDTKMVADLFGCFTQADLDIIWADEQHADMHDELLQLMMKFKLCYEIPHRPKTYIAPQLLSPNEPEYAWDDTDNLILRYHYEFMPKGMLTRFIVEMHKLIARSSPPTLEAGSGELVWKDGVILKDGDTRAEVIEARYKNEIRIRISGCPKKTLLERIRHEFGKIHDSYGERLRYQEFIPCNCSVCKGSQTPFSYSLDHLQERLKNKRHEIECHISYQMVNVRGLIDDVSRGGDQPVPSTATDMKIFVSYSHADAEWLTKLQIHLKSLARKGAIDLWDDTPHPSRRRVANRH
ncbi:MAG: GTPase [Phormidesmis sp. CAN_BIN44]|nr:GTPase [Phormidesmis sp. CAN_BIN44]